MQFFQPFRKLSLKTSASLLTIWQLKQLLKTHYKGYNVDFYFLLDVYKIEEYEIEESYYSIYDYLPKQFIEFVLEKDINLSALLLVVLLKNIGSNKGYKKYSYLSRFFFILNTKDHSSYYSSKN